MFLHFKISNYEKFGILNLMKVLKVFYFMRCAEIPMSLLLKTIYPREVHVSHTYDRPRVAITTDVAR